MQNLLLFHCDFGCKIAPHCNAPRTLPIMLKISCLGAWRFKRNKEQFEQMLVLIYG
jgi:hypothetical protein